MTSSARIGISDPDTPSSSSLAFPADTSTPLGDGDLMEQILQGDVDAFVGLFERHAPAAMALARRVLRERNLAEEAVQEAFIAVWQAPVRYRADRGSVRSWLMSIVHHRSVDLVRREASQHRRAEEASAPVVAEATVDPGDAVVERFGLEEDRRAIRGALDALPPAQRQVIELMYFGGLSQIRIAEQMSVPLGTVKSRTLLGMRRLRAALDGSDL